MSDFYRELELARRECRPKERDFALSLASGLSQSAAYCAVYGEKHRKNEAYIKQRVAKLLSGPAGRYFGLLCSPMNDQIIAPYMLDRAERLRLLSMGAVLAFKQSESGDDASAINPMVRCINEINKMTGEHAAQEVEVKQSVLAAVFTSALDDTQATDIYRKVLQGARIKTESIEHKTVDELPNYQPLRQTIDAQNAIPCDENDIKNKKE